MPTKHVTGQVAPAAATSTAVEHDSLERDYGAELPRMAATEPQAALATFSMAEGFRIELAASEPLVTDPVAVAFDEHGRLFVVEMRDYSEQPDDHLGRIRLLEDTDHDGVYETSTVFADQLSWPTAIACYDGGILIGATPDILFLKDTDGDGRADVQERVFTGFSRDNVQGLLNSFIWSFDQRLFGATSSSGGEVRALRVSDQAAVSLRRRDFAIQPGTMTIEAVSGGGQHGLSFDRWGNRYASANSDHIQLYEIDDRYLERNPSLTNLSSRRSIAEDGPAAEVYRASPPEPWRVVRTRLRLKGMVNGPVEGGGRAAGYFTGATGVTIYTGDAVPPDLPSQTYAFVGDVGGNLVHRKRIDRQGLQRIARRVDPGREFLASTDNWFRPVQFANGPDGALYVIDMYRETIEHPLSLPPLIKKHLDLTSGRDRGRIYRVVPLGFQHEKRKLPGEASISELVEMLGHSNGWHRETAARLLAGQLAGDVIPALRSVLTNRSQWETNPDLAIRVLYGLDGFAALADNDLILGLRHAHAQVRRHAVLLAEGRLSRIAIQDQLGASLVALCRDPDPEVRMQVALTIGSMPIAVKLTPLTSLALEQTAASDQRLMHAAILSSIADCRVEFAQSLLSDQTFGTSQNSLELLRTVLQQIGTASSTANDPAYMASFASLIQRLRAQEDSAASHQLIATLLMATDTKGDALLRKLKQAGVDDAAEWFSQLTTNTQQITADESAATTTRIHAMQFLQTLSPSAGEQVAEDFLSPDVPFELQTAAVEVLGSTRNVAVTERLLSRMSRLHTGAKRRGIDLLLQRREGQNWIATAVLHETLSAQELTASQRTALLAANANTATSRQLQARLSQGDESRQVVWQQYEQVLNLHGNLASGREVFRQVCASCHRLEDHGQTVGPDLSVLVGRGAAFLLTNVLDPNREVDPRYEAYLVVTDDGRSLSGVITKETATGIELLLANGVRETLARSSIAEMRGSGLSLMPVGMERDITPAAMADLLAYLQSFDQLRADASTGPSDSLPVDSTSAADEPVD